MANILIPPTKKKLFQAIEVAELEAAVRVPKMHSSALAVTEKLAGAALVLFHPGPVAINLETVIPHFHKIILVDIALIVVCTDANAGRNGAVVEN